LWPTTVDRVSDGRARLHLQSKLKDAHVVITGAGTSAYAATAVASAWPESAAVASTDLLLATERYIRDANVLLSLARSGDSPESIAVVHRVHRLRPDVWHLAITCNSRGALATSSLVNSIVLDPRTNDQSLVMTSSFSNLVLAGLCLANRLVMGPLTECAAAQAQVQFCRIDKATSALAQKLEDRIVLLASAPLFGWAQEGALKVLEMTGGKFPVMAETYLGLRHGPMSFIRDNTMVVCLLANDPWIRRYEIDLITELKAKGLGYLIGICSDDSESTNPPEIFDVVIPALLPQAPDSLRTPFEILAPQLFAYHLSVQSGLNPDNPSPAGVINRVVQGIHIHE